MTKSLLTRYWIKTSTGYGIGVTAYSVDDMRELLRKAEVMDGRDFQILEVVEDVDVSALDPGHVLPNIGPTDMRGVWFPNLNLRAE